MWSKEGQFLGQTDVKTFEVGYYGNGKIFTYVQYHLAGLQVRFDLIDLTLGQKRIDNNDRGHLWSLFTSF